MVGGGEGAFIGAVHRAAVRLDDQFTLVAGAFSSEPARSIRSGIALGLDPARCYPTYEAMFAAEALRQDPIEAVAIVTPNDTHAAVALAALEAGLHVICDKPLTTTVADAEALQRAANYADRFFAVTYNYSASPMIRQARAMVASGALGDIRVIQVRYAQAWLAGDLESTGQKQAQWRTDPARSGAGGAIGDIGTHAFHLAGFVSGLAPVSLLADLHTYVPGRKLDDNAHVLLRYAGDARGMLWASQLAHGHENDLRLAVYGTDGGLEWSQEAPDRLWLTPVGGERRLIVRGGAGMGPEAARMSRLPGGHPEGYLEAFAGLYGEIARAISGEAALYPNVADGAAGVRFVAAAVRSSAEGGIWVNL